MLKFTKLSATGNDFILFDNRQKILTGKEHDFFHQICQRRTGVGADGILLIEKSEKFNFSMRYYNSDGYLGEMCGNGARASAFYACTQKIAGTELTFDVLGIPYRASVKNDCVKLSMPPPVEIREYPAVLEEPAFKEGGYLNVGVPHYIIFVPDVELVDVQNIGRKYRYHQAFSPWGTNSNFVQLIDKNTIKIRTYERGVEEETLACGTGTISAALLAHKQKGLNPPFTVQTKGGILRVDFDEKLAEIALEGQVKIVYFAELNENAFLK